MEESSWDQRLIAVTNRYYIIDPLAGEVTPHAQSLQAYTEKDYESLMEECGYTKIAIYPSLKGIPDPKQPNLFAIISSRP